MQQGESPYAETALAINTGACTKVARRISMTIEEAVKQAKSYGETTITGSVI